MVPLVKKGGPLAPPQFFFHEQEDFSEVMDTEGRVFEPLECGYYWMLWETLVGMKNHRFVRVRDPIPRSLEGCRSKASPTRPLCPGLQENCFSDMWSIFVRPG